MKENAEAAEPTDLDAHSRSVGALTVLRGLLAIAFGFIALANPGATAAALVIVFAAWALVDAVFSLAAAVRRGRERQRWGWFVFEGIVSAGAGIVALAYPAITLFALVVIVAVRAILLGAFLIAGVMTWTSLPARWLYVVSGIVSIVFGVLLLWRPLVGTLALVWTMGIYALVAGSMSFILGVEILGLRRLQPRGPAYGT